MRLAWVLTLLLALFPESFSFRGKACECCDESSSCSATPGRSCCEKPEGPVIVARCGCGMDHGPRHVSREPFEWYGVAPEPVRGLVPDAARPVERAPLAPLSRREAPEPPPPRRVG